MGRKTFSYELEKTYYSQHWPQDALPYLHLEPYLRCWLNPKNVFGGKRVLDIGAGECTYTRLIINRFGAKEVVACDLFRERMLPVFRENKGSNLRFVTADILCLPFKANSFDVVFGSLVLSHLPDLQMVVPEIQRVLKKGGLYIGIEPNCWNPVVLYRQILRLHASPNQYLLGKRQLIVFEKFGFRVELSYFYSGLPYIHNKFIGTCIGILAELQGKEATDFQLNSQSEG